MHVDAQPAPPEDALEQLRQLHDRGPGIDSVLALGTEREASHAAPGNGFLLDDYDVRPQARQVDCHCEPPS